MSDEITPALTPEEWREWGPGAEHESVEWTAARFDGRRDAIAALMLHGQPFGFTHEDVALLRRAIETAWYHCEVSDAERAVLDHLAARLAALLPPRDPA